MVVAVATAVIIVEAGAVAGSEAEAVPEAEAGSEAEAVGADVSGDGGSVLEMSGADVDVGAGPDSFSPREPPHPAPNRHPSKQTPTTAKKAR